MADFLLIQHQNRDLNEGRPSPQQLQNSIPNWQHWYEIIAARNTLKYLAADGVIVREGTAGREYDMETTELIGGLTFVQAANYEEAVEIAGRCPILKLGGIVEIRMIYRLDDKY